MARELLEPILDGGIANPHYFDGRVLTATALRDDQEAHRARQRRLGRAVGAGVVEGLWVRVEAAGSGSEPPVLRLGRGLAINRRGETLELPADELLALSKAPEVPGCEAGLFRDCRPPSVGIETTGEGFYVLVLSPASGYGGRAPMSGLGEATACSGCGSRWAFEGVQLRLEPLDPLAVTGTSETVRTLLADELLGATGAADRARLRNVLAHLCLGTGPRQRLAADPFAREATAEGGSEPELARYGALDDLAAAGRLTACDVPLALVDWRLEGLGFADNWSVRRRPQAPAADADWPTLASGRRRAEGEAALLQFQEQLAAELAAAADPSALTARELFHWLPPAGLVPVAAAGRRGVSNPAFWSGVTVRLPTPEAPALYADGARLQELLVRSLELPPVEVSTGELLWTYRIRQNHPVPDAAGGAVGDDVPYLVFASGHLPFAGTARFDVARWDRSNYGLL